jgi:hypothetical protein
LGRFSGEPQQTRAETHSTEGTGAIRSANQTEEKPEPEERTARDQNQDQDKDTQQTSQPQTSLNRICCTENHPKPSAFGQPGKPADGCEKEPSGRNFPRGAGERKTQKDKICFFSVGVV